MMRQNRSRQIPCGVIGVVKRKMRGRKVGRCWKYIYGCAREAAAASLFMHVRLQSITVAEQVLRILLDSVVALHTRRVCMRLSARAYHVPLSRRASRRRFSRADAGKDDARTNGRVNRCVTACVASRKTRLSIDLAREF